MDFIKKQPFMTLFLVVSIVVAAFLAVKIKSASDSARQSGEKINELKAFGLKERTASYSANQTNVEISEENLKQTQDKLLQLRQALYQASHVKFDRQVTNTQCKNHLFEGTGKLVEELDKKGIFVSEPAKYLSFGTVINAENLPDETTEVPVLMKQFEIISDIVEIMKNSEIARLISLNRPEEVRTADKKQFQVMPLSMTIEGSSSSVERFLSDLQKDKNYYFVIRNITFTAKPPIIGDSLKSTTETLSSSPSMLAPDFIGGPSVGGPGDVDGEGAPKPLYAEQFKVRFPDRVTADIRFDFVEFKKPVEEK